MIPYHEVMTLLVAYCPSFAWSRHAEGVDSVDGACVHVMHFAGHLIWLLEEDTTQNFWAVFATVELVLAEGDPGACRLINDGLLKDLTDADSYRDLGAGPAGFLAWYGPLARAHPRVKSLLVDH